MGALFLVAAVAAQSPVTLPPGAAADAWARVDANTEPAALAPPAWPVWEDDAAWSERPPWQRWVEAVLEEAAAAEPDPGRRAPLALLAAKQGRALDAWDHFAACAESPGVVAALLPRLFPGVPADEAVGPGGLAGALPDGVLLSPILPPLHGDPPHGRPRVRAMELQGLAIGEAVCDLKLSVEVDGVEVTFTHRSGGPARVRLRLPRPPDFEIRALYVNWQRLDVVSEVLDLELLPEQEGGEGETAVWGRFFPAGTPWPTAVPERLPAAVARGGLVLEHDPDDPLAPRLTRCAEALGMLVGVPARVATRGATSAPLVIRLNADLDPRVRAAKLAAVLSLAERYALRRERG